MASSGLAGVLLLSGLYQLTRESLATLRLNGSILDDPARYEERSAQRGLVVISSRLQFWVGLVRGH